MEGFFKVKRACLRTRSITSPLLISCLSEHVEFTEDALIKVSLWINGVLEVTNLQLKVEAVNRLFKLFNLPIKLKMGYLGSGKIKFPKWSSFIGQGPVEPVEVELHHISVLAALDTSVEGARNQLVRSNSTWLVSTILTLVLTWLVYPILTLVLTWLVYPIRTLVLTWLAPTIRTLVGNLKISITHVHIRFEGEESNVGHHLVLGLTLAKLVVRNDEGTSATGSARDCVQKSGEVDRLSISFETDTKPLLILKSRADFKEQDHRKKELHMILQSFFLNDEPEFYDAEVEFYDAGTEFWDDCSEKEAIGPTLTVSDSINGPSEAPVLPERHLRATLSVVVRFSMEGNNLELKYAELNGLTVKSTSGVNVLEPFDACVTYSQVTAWKEAIHASITIHTWEIILQRICTKFSYKEIRDIIRLLNNAGAFVGSSSPQSALGLADLRTQSQPDNLTVANMEVTVTVEVKNVSAKLYDNFGGLMAPELLELSIDGPVKATFHDRDMKTSIVIDVPNLTLSTYNSKSHGWEPVIETCDFRCGYKSDPQSDKPVQSLVETRSDFKVNMTVTNVNMGLKIYSKCKNLSKIEASSKKQKLQVIRLRPHTSDLEAGIKENGGGHEIEQLVATQGATEPMQDEQERRAEAPFHKEIIVKFPKIELSIIDQKPQELVLLSLEKVEVIYATGQDEKGVRFEASVGYLQADNQLPNTPRPMHVLMASERVGGEDQVIKFIATMKAESNEAVQVYSNLDLKVHQGVWVINLHEALLWAIWEMLQNLQLDQLELDSDVQVDSEICIENVDISEVRLQISGKSSPEQCPLDSELAGNVLVPLIIQLCNIDNFPITVPRKKMENFRKRKSQMPSRIKWEIWNQINLLSLFARMDHFGVTSSVLRVLSQWLKKLSEHDHNRSEIQINDINLFLRELESNDEIGVRDGVIRGFKHFGLILKSGAKESKKIIKGAQENGPAEFFQGIGKGIAEFASSTAVGALEGAALATKGIGNTCSKRKHRPDNSNLERSRPPRAFKGPGIVIPYDSQAAANDDMDILQAAQRDGNGMSENESLLASDGYEDLDFPMLSN